MTTPSPCQALLALVRDQALQFGDFTLASGKKAPYYLDCRRVTLDSAGAHWIAQGVLELLGDDLPDAVGGMAIGADPITGAVIALAHQQQRHLRGFIVRKQPKQYGLGRDVEGPVQPGQTAVVLEDVVTTGGSSLKAIERLEEYGLTVRGVIAVVDRLEGAAEALGTRGYPLQSLLTVRDLGVDPL